MYCWILVLLIFLASKFAETARRNRQIRKRRQKWVWGSIAAAITLGMTTLAWSYLPAMSGSSSSSDSHSPEHDDTTN